MFVSFTYICRLTARNVRDIHLWKFSIFASCMKWTQKCSSNSLLHNSLQSHRPYALASEKYRWNSSRTLGIALRLHIRRGLLPSLARTQILDRIWATGQNLARDPLTNRLINICRSLARSHRKVWIKAANTDRSCSSPCSNSTDFSWEFWCPAARQKDHVLAASQ